MRGEAAQLARTVVVGFPVGGIIGLIDFLVADGVEDGEGEVSSLGGVE